MKQQTISSVLLSPLSTLLILCVAILSQLTFVSCKDEDLTEEEKQQKQEQENNEQFLLTSEFWQVVGQLSNAEVLPDDWQHATFEPGIGEASDKSSTTRIVLTNEAEAAAESFENLTGADVSNLSSYEWKRDFGSLTYQRLHDGTGWAAVDVDIKQMPGLKRIIYCTPEQQGLNASVPGTPYYRFGDVIKKPNANNEMEYWVCVRPCFGPEKKGDMHWMCLGSLPDNFIKSYEYKGQHWYWYKSLTTNDEHIKNLSEMTFAILNPTQWADYYEKNQNKYMFHDFHYENIKYINRYFWQLVQDAWNEPLNNEGGKTVAELLFHRKVNDMKDDRKGGNQLHFFYGTADGLGTFTWYMKMQTITFDHHESQNTYKFREYIKQNHKKSCEHLEFDIREYSADGHPTLSTYFDSNLYIYPLRYATGKQLLGSQPNYYQTMDGSNRIQDVYVFNKHYNVDFGSTEEMIVFKEQVQPIDEIPEGKPISQVEKADIGKVVGKNAMIYDNVADAQKAGTQAIAMVAAIANTDFKLDDVSDTNKNKEYENKYGIKKAIAFALEDGPKVQNFPHHSGNGPILLKNFSNEYKKWADDHNVDGTSWYFLNSYYIQRMVMDCGGNLPSIYTLDRLETELGKRENVFSGHKIDGWKLLEKMAACGDNARLYKNANWLYSLSDNKVTVEDKEVYIYFYVDKKYQAIRPGSDWDVLHTRNVIVW